MNRAAGVPGALPSANACVRAGPMLGETLFKKRVFPQTPSLKTGIGVGCLGRSQHMLGLQSYVRMEESKVR